MDQQQFQFIQKSTRSLPMELASIILGVLSITTCTCLYTSIIFGSLAIIFALLSRGGELTMSGRAKTGLWLGIAGIVLFVGAIVLSIVVIASYGGIEPFMEQYDQLLQQFYGVSLEDMYGSEYKDMLNMFQ